jgi:RNA polymerase sigma factor (sigma-70 family)
VHKAIEQDRLQRNRRKMRDEILQKIATLTSRERQVFELVTKGMLNKQIASDLNVSEKTVKVHRSRVMEKMDADSLADLVRMAEKAGGNEYKNIEASHNNSD